jgi:hypothetical protein
VAAVADRLARAGVTVSVVAEEPADPPSGLLGAVWALDRRLLGLPPDPDAPAAAPEAAGGAPELVLDLSGVQSTSEMPVWRVLVDGSPAVRPEPYLRALHRSRRTCTVTIEETLPTGEARVVASAVSAVDPVSIARTRDPILWKLVEMLGRALERETASVGGPGPAVPTRRLGPVTLALWCARAGARIVRRRVRKLLGRDTWFIAVRAQTELPANASELAAALVRAPAPAELAGPPGMSQADPFVFERDGSTYLFFEQASPSMPGRIAVAELDGVSLRGSASPCLVRDHHVSYPFVFAHEGDVFLMPESLASRSVDLYRATSFPHEWTHERTLLDDVLAVDPTLIRHDGLWWLFVGVSAPGAAPGEELALYYADSLDGEWTAHPENPVVADVRCARPAGPLLRLGDSLVRPAQDGSRGYGSAIALRRIVTLTRDRYREEGVGEVTADWLRHAHATHTYGRGSTVEVTDGQRWIARGLR